VEERCFPGVLQVHAGRLVIDSDQFFGVGIRERLQQDAIEHAEQRILNLSQIETLKAKGNTKPPFSLRSWRAVFS
jgi:hypothetical protein